MSINPNPLSNLLINCIFTKSAPQVLSIKDYCTFLLEKFLIIGLCNSSANSLLEMSLFLLADLFSRTYDRARVAAPPEFATLIPSYFKFLGLLNALSRNIA